MHLWAILYLILNTKLFFCKVLSTYWYWHVGFNRYIHNECHKLILDRQSTLELIFIEVSYKILKIATICDSKNNSYTSLLRVTNFQNICFQIQNIPRISIKIQLPNILDLFLSIHLNSSALNFSQKRSFT